MVSKDFEVGDLVWAKMKGYPLWPGKIEEPLPDAKPPKNKKAHFVYFFGTKNFAWILDENINRHSESLLNNLCKKKSVAYQSAIEDFVKFSKINLKDKHSPKKEKSKSDSKKSPKVFKVVTNTSKKVDKKVSASKAIRKDAKKRAFDNVNGGYSEYTSPKSRKLAYDEEYPLHGSTPPTITNSGNTHGSACDANESIKKAVDAESIKKAVDAYIDDIRCGRPSLSLLRVNRVPPPKLKIGFIGLGFIGTPVVRAFLRAGYEVTVWNKNLNKCEDLVKLHAKKAQSPAELIVTCDITFSSVSDPEASKSLIFGERGILKGLEQAEKLGFRNRGYVEMTSIDPETSQEIAEAIGRKNGKYLEAPICGNSDDVLNSKLIILAAGDRQLFIDCEPYFEVIGKHAYYVSCEVGMGAKYSLVLSSFAGSMLVVAAECMSLVSQLGLKDDVFLDILKGGPLQSHIVLEKCRKMLKCDFKTVTPLRYMQKDLNFTLQMGNKVSQTMPVTAAANEVYKHARLLQYADSDVSAVYQGVRH